MRMGVVMYGSLLGAFIILSVSAGLGRCWSHDDFRRSHLVRCLICSVGGPLREEHGNIIIIISWQDLFARSVGISRISGVIKGRAARKEVAARKDKETHEREQVSGSI